jgi:hypothetical protein
LAIGLRFTILDELQIVFMLAAYSPCLGLGLCEILTGESEDVIIDWEN